MAQTDTTGQLSWLLDNLVNQVEHVQQAVILSRDGLVVAASRGLTREDGEHLSALAAGVQSLARGAGRHFHGGEVRQTIIEMEQAFLFVIAAGKGTCLAVLTSGEPNVGLTSEVDLPLGVVRVLLGDLVSEGLVRIVSAQRQQLPDQRLLRMVLDGLESL